MSNSELPVYSIEEFDQEARDLYANTLAVHLKHHHFIKVAHKHDFYLTVLFTKGTGVHEVDFIKYPVKRGAVFFLNPGQVHNWTLSNDIDGYIFFHTKEFYDLRYQLKSIQDFPFFSSIYNTPMLSANARVLKNIIPLFREILDEHKGRRALKSSRLCSLIDLLYIDLTRVYVPKEKEPEGNTSYMQKFRKLESLIDKHFREEKSPAAYAGMMNMTTKHLNRICRSCVDKTLTDIILDRVILEAKRLLVQPGYSVVDVANAVGMFDQSYFTRLFKKSTGLTPTGFTKKYRGTEM